MPSCATAIAETLREGGVRFVFGHPGGEVVDLIDALEKTGIRFILTGHEAAAAFMASAVGRLTGTPGVCLATLGPGACNLVLGVGAAYLDRDPLVALSALSPVSRSRVSQKQNLPLNDLFDPVCKWSVALEKSGIRATVRSALQVSTAAPAGPVYLSIPNDVAVADAAPGEGASTPDPTRACIGSLDGIAAAMNRAERPVGVVGIALDAHRDSAAVRRFFSESEIPYVVLPQAKGIPDEFGRGYLGTVASAAGDAVLVDMISRSDCILGVGFDPVESAQDWHLRQPVFSLADCSIAFGDFSPASECVGNVTILLDRLLTRYKARPLWTAAEIRRAKDGVADSICPDEESREIGLSPFHLIREIRETLPAETILSVDVGAHKMLISQVWRPRSPGTFLTSNGLSAMGYGLPSALAASLLRPGHPVAGVFGDAGFAMMVQELETACRLGLRPLLVVMCDRSLAIVKVAQAMRKLPCRGVDFQPVDWAGVADGFGATGVTVTTLEDMRRAGEAWLAKPELTVVAARVDERLYTGMEY
ncbi:MAG: thiamine pyrophosphate-binding protein [Gemmatimonadota bacterium]|nr:thiamine pyrophosphate-binding protein [Gemmatimonadota bacterium]